MRLSAAAEAYGCGPLAGADPPLFVVPGPAGGRMLLAKEDVGNYFDGVLDALTQGPPLFQVTCISTGRSTG